MYENLHLQTHTPKYTYECPLIYTQINPDRPRYVYTGTRLHTAIKSQTEISIGTNLRKSRHTHEYIDSYTERFKRQNKQRGKDIGTNKHMRNSNNNITTDIQIYLETNGEKR